MIFNGIEFIKKYGKKINLFKFTKAHLHTVCVSSHTYTTLYSGSRNSNYLKKKSISAAPVNKENVQ